MTPQFISLRNLRFLLYELLDTEALLEHPYYEDHDREVFDLVLDTAERMGRELLLPSLQEMDRDAPRLVDGVVRVHPTVRALMEACGEGGWIGAQASEEHGGQQLPGTVMAAFRAILAAANYSASVYPMLTSGAAHLIASFGSEALIERYLPKMYAGEWQGTMALTEPQAGSSLADLRTTAVPTEGDYYNITGQKIFISCAEHDGVENTVHLLLARIRDAPAGIKGISLFVVPSQRVDAAAGLVPNDVTCAALYHKLGYRGSPITQLSFGESDDCRGWLVGEPHRGLKYMFQMMNEARVEVGMGAAAIGSAAYCAALQYTRERPQGRRITVRDPSQPQIPIIEHPDVRRMLLFQRAVVEGSLALGLHCARLEDSLRVLEGDEREEQSLLLDLLTPVAKSYASEMAFLAVSQALQCLGGYGYCDEFPIEQYLRDARIHPIHEGTTGIQALDLLGRKVVMQSGRATFLYLARVEADLEQARGEEALVPLADALAQALERLQGVTQHLTGMAMEGRIDEFLADATCYLELFGTVTIGWQWLRQAVVAQRALAKQPVEEETNFYRGKIHTARFFFAYELPKTEGLASCLLASEGLTVEMDASVFSD